MNLLVVLGSKDIPKSAVKPELKTVGLPKLMLVPDILPTIAVPAPLLPVLP